MGEACGHTLAKMDAALELLGQTCSQSISEFEIISYESTSNGEPFQRFDLRGWRSRVGKVIF